MSPRADRYSATAEQTVRLDTKALLAAGMYEQAVQAAQRAPRTRRRGRPARVPDAAQREALLATLRDALVDVDARVLREMMCRACEAEPAEPYESMRTVLSVAAPQVGFVCPRCGERVPPGVQARVGVCPHCQ